MLFVFLVSEDTRVFLGHQMHVSVSLAREATTALKLELACVSFVNDEHDECCADSGATMHMLPDYACFVSYKSCKGKFVALGDHTQLPLSLIHI